jgi:hypothetical protein
MLSRTAVLVLAATWSLASCSGEIGGAMYVAPGGAGPDPVTPGAGGAGGGGTGGSGMPPMTMGGTGGTVGAGGMGGVCETSSYAPGSIRLFSPTDYANTLAAVTTELQLAALPLLAPALPPMPPGFKNRIGALELSAEYTEVVTRNATLLAQALVANKGRISPGCVAPSPESACVTAVLGPFAKILFRRPLTAEEQMDYGEHFAGLRARWSYDISLHGLLELLFASPSFFHRQEVGAPVPGKAGVRQLTSFEMASALSYAILEGPPDAELVRAADANLLREPRDIDAQVSRLTTGKAVPGLVRFFTDLLDVDRVATGSKSATLFPFYKAPVPALLVESFQRQAETLVSSATARFDEYFSGTSSFVRKELAPIYGMNATTTPATFTAQPVQPTVRAGLYTHPAFLTALADEEKAKPVHRARALMTLGLCLPFPDPPPEADEVQPPTDPGLTDRQRFEIQTSQTLCQGCHSVLNPLSHAFESFDAVGRYSLMNGTEVIDPAGWLNVPSRKIEFKTTRELLTALAAEPKARECFSQNWYSYLLGRSMQAADSCSWQRSFSEFERQGWVVQPLLKSVFTSDSFRYRKGV